MYVLIPTTGFNRSAVRSAAAESPRGNSTNEGGGSLGKWGQGSPRGTGQINARMEWRVQGQADKVGCGWSKGSCGQVLSDRGCGGRLLW
jgi:hypothetical protein